MAIAPPACRPIESTAERGLTLAHDFAAPARVVYQAFTQPELVRRWWGASSITTVCQAEVREGGQFMVTLRTFNGGAVRATGTYRLVAPNEAAGIHRRRGSRWRIGLGQGYVLRA